uniref:RNA polymerase II C-terminal domain phosphatase-like n=2 Tax=Aegilops tauschii subsp. strangulata TaxID=200361 RepID=A0A452Z135_AEGTS
MCSHKRCRVAEQHQDQGTATRPEEDAIGSVKDAQIKICPPHTGFIGGLCYICGKNQDEEDFTGVPFGYIAEGLRLSNSEMDRLSGSEVKNLLRERKLVLILDLDHTLINSTRLHDISAAEMDLGIQSAASKNDPDRSLFTLQGMCMLTKLRPFVRKFLEEASNMFEMYIYTMGFKAYAIEIAKLLDPGNVYFDSKVISNSDCTQQHQKGLDVVPGADSLAVVLDDTEYVWQKHKENLILMERYHYFAASCRHSGQSLSELMQDERESDGALATILDVLKRIHTIFFDLGVGTALSSRDVRPVGFDRVCDMVSFVVVDFCLVTILLRVLTHLLIGNQEDAAGSTAGLQTGLQSSVPVRLPAAASDNVEDGRAAGRRLLLGGGSQRYACGRRACRNGEGPLGCQTQEVFAPPPLDRSLQLSLAPPAGGRFPCTWPKGGQGQGKSCRDCPPVTEYN